MGNSAAFERELQEDRALCERVLRELPSASAQPEPVTIRTDRMSVDRAICQALVLAVAGIEARIELTE